MGSIGEKRQNASVQGQNRDSESAGVSRRRDQNFRHCRRRCRPGGAAPGRIRPLRSPLATSVWDYINRGMPLNREGTLTSDEVYSLTAFLLFINEVFPEDQVLDQQPY